MTAAWSQWSYVIAAALFGAIAFSQLRRDAKTLGGRALAVGLSVTAFASLIEAFLPVTPVAAAPGAIDAALTQMRHLGWLAFLYLLWRKGARLDHAITVRLLYLVVACLFATLAVVPGLVETFDLVATQSQPAMQVNALLHILAIVGALVLVHNLYTAGSTEERDALRLPLVAITAMWIYELNLFTNAYLAHSWPTELFHMRGLVLILAAPLFALTVLQNRSFALRLSRAATFQSIGLVAIGAYLIAMFAVTAGLDFLGGEMGRLAQVSFVFAASLAALLLGPSAKFRAWFRVKVSKHFFQHRYDYRAEWLRFTETLGRPDDQASALGVRVVQAIADILESPSGLLLSLDGNGSLLVRAQWNWTLSEPPSVAAQAKLGTYLLESSRVIELDTLRLTQTEVAADEEASLVPEWMLSEPQIWAIVPLVHFGKLAGLIVMTRPLLSRRLDWEDFDLLRVVGRQGASYLAEAQVQEDLSDALRFDEFNRRFAFIMHDIKNLVSQLSLVTRNAERHADNPEFRVDMIETLKSSTARMNALLARLSQHHKAKAEEPKRDQLGPLVERLVATKAAQHPILIAGDLKLFAKFDAVRLEQALSHLVQNAIEASDPTEPVTVCMRSDGPDVLVEVIDKGCGMSAAFIDSRLYKPFSSSKDGGFGIGTYEARSNILEMGGLLQVTSREGVGTTFAVRLPNGVEQTHKINPIKALAA